MCTIIEYVRWVLEGKQNAFRDSMKSESWRSWRVRNLVNAAEQHGSTSYNNEFPLEDLGFDE